MSRIGKLPIEVPSDVTLTIEGKKVEAKGKLATLSTVVPSEVSVAMNDNVVTVTPNGNDKRSRSMWGMSRTNIVNIIEGVSKGFEKKLELRGVGYRANIQGDILTMTLGYSHEIKYAIPAGVDIKVETNTTLIITGADKQMVGQVAAEIRSMRKPEPYKGKGVRYADEYVRMKEGKKK